MPRIFRLMKHGNGYVVTIPGPIRRHIGWQPNDALVVEELADQSVLIRRPRISDLVPVVNPDVNGPRFDGLKP